jgi:gamma-glutamyl phosphate reductase
MSEPPMQRMIDAWLKAHHLTEKELESLPPEKRDAILKQMAADIKNEMKRKIEANFTS